MKGGTNPNQPVFLNTTIVNWDNPLFTSTLSPGRGKSEVEWLVFSGTVESGVLPGRADRENNLLSMLTRAYVVKF